MAQGIGQGYQFGYREGLLWRTSRNGRGGELTCRDSVRGQLSVYCTPNGERILFLGAERTLFG